MKAIPVVPACGRTLLAAQAQSVSAGGAAEHDAWHLVGPLDACFSGTHCHGVTIASVQVGLFLVGDEIHALDDICTHGNARLSDGLLEGHEIECPLHAGLVDVRTGKAAAAPIVRDARRHEVRVENGNLYVKLNARPGC